ncbi:MAG: 2,3-bisphosphoglycerate-independent phosphoglycerate mutase [bacterium]|nr:2,3-bisphosphoglycerate-independent phosphoglycerate mutase [bacterium]
MPHESLKELYRPVVLLILDGFGIDTPSRANAISQANTPVFDNLITTYPSLVLQASGEATGLPWSEAGNSEVGHTNIGAGRIVYQELTRISNDIVHGRFAKNPAISEAMEAVNKNNSALHLVGMTSSGGMHSHIDHLFALLESAKEHNVKKVYIHAILDGRDTPRASGIDFVKKIIAKTEYLGVGTIASLSGRFYSMDRDNHWDRTEKGYRAIIEGISENKDTDVLHAVQASYNRKVYDEEFEPTVITTESGDALGMVSDNDVIIMFNFRVDRMRQISHAIADPNFSRFDPTKRDNLFIVTMTQYDETLPVHTAYLSQRLEQCLPQVLSDNGLTQLHIAETEKYAHVTYFLNGGTEQPVQGEERLLIASPRVTSYAEKPEMSSRAITDAVTHAIKAGDHDCIIVNLANADMVGHTGNFEKTKEAIEIIDGYIGAIVETVLSRKGAMLITADHGNAEHLFDLQTGEVDKVHTNNPVPCVIIAQELEGVNRGTIDIAGTDLSILEPSGLLSDVAPTVLRLLGISPPPAMSGHNLLEL